MIYVIALIIWFVAFGALMLCKSASDADNSTEELIKK